ncbi:Copia protein, partial [Mucuna pruriens]
MDNGFSSEKVDITLFHKNHKSHFILVQIYVDNIIFGVTNESLCKDFSKIMQYKFEISMMEKLKFFLGLQIKQTNEGIYIHKSKYANKMLKKFKLKECKSMYILMLPTSILTLENNEKKVNQTTYHDTTNLRLLFKKSNKYRYNLYGSKIPIYCDNIATINLSKNPILHSRAKHIDIKHHFIRDYVQKGIVNLKFISLEQQLVDIFTKPLPKDKLIHIRDLLGIKFIKE